MSKIFKILTWFCGAPTVSGLNKGLGYRDKTIDPEGSEETKRPKDGQNKVNKY